MEFLDLPLEIRHQIYLLVFPKGRPGTSALRPSYKNRCVGWQPPYKSGVDVSILYTCRQIYVEATRALYGDNKFIFFGHNVLIEFLRRIGPRNASFVSHIEVFGSYYDTYNRSFTRALRLAPSLKKVTIEASLTPCSVTESEIHKLDFLREAFSILSVHPSLDRLVSKYPGGLQRSLQGRTFHAYMKVTIVAVSAHKIGDGTVVDLEEEMNRKPNLTAIHES